LRGEIQRECMPSLGRAPCPPYSPSARVFPRERGFRLRPVCSQGKSPQCVSFHSDSDARAHASRALQADPTERARLLDRRGIEARPRGRPIRAKPRQETARGEPHTKIVFHASPTTLLHTLERKVAVRPGLSSSAGSPNLYHLRSLRATPQRGRSYEPTKQCHYNNTPCCIL
jgi:hypothetical protein